MDHGQYLIAVSLLHSFYFCYALHTNFFELRLRVDYGVQKEKNEQKKGQIPDTQCYTVNYNQKIPPQVSCKDSLSSPAGRFKTQHLTSPGSSLSVNFHCLYRLYGSDSLGFIISCRVLSHLLTYPAIY
ncbi:hypothetical protein MSHOH_2344 [Methanosarcina horonobensis HB-1 = JCM 15518]|uniref:Uncharacterized protein n=1 Tax=Methanosarcina horonobensis HB-1 = JCM 15518 TaxID=1434110 RepID=A0A0E3SF13_9EURY|nr:hypothetical protein MSHOH_2344 [Methanosarcina horonobensis HB-1 = JCM 15518]